MPPQNTPPQNAVKPEIVDVLNEFLKLHKEEELVRLAYRARKTHRFWLSDILQAEIRDRTPE